jgi:alkanesulfonate monooxygenase SsuD/methylene tetrahydromethanopterin reductase-like flavin-dependent oxidoreductase (luciferase family)
MPDLRLGALCWNQYTDWPSLLAAGRRADELGYHSLWTWDHLYPIVGSSDGPIHEGWLTLGAWAQATTQIRVGLMVGANTFREPALTAKMATTLDHISNGRATLGIGGAWFEEEHLAYGIPYGDGFPERLRWLGEALPIMRGMLRGDRPTAAGGRYHARDVRNDPTPIQKRLPLLIGGGGEQVTLKLVARYGDANNVGGGIENVRRKEAVLVRHCEAVGRNPADIERTASLGVVVIRDSRAEARKVAKAIFARNGRATPWENQPVGTPEDLLAFVEPYPEIGYRHLIGGFPSPYDEESMTRFITEVVPKVGASA